MDTDTREQLDMKYSVIVLLDKLYSDTISFIENIHNLFSSLPDSFEMLVILNGLSGIPERDFKRIIGQNNGTRMIEFAFRTWPSVCLKAGFKDSRGEFIVVCDSYQQVPNDSILKLLNNMDRDVSIVSALRRNRIDSRRNQIESRFFNYLVRKIIDCEYRDLSSCVRIFRREVLEQTDFYGNMYRFLPILAERNGFKTKEVQCDHCQQRGEGGLRRFSYFLNALIDIITVFFNTHFNRKPFRFFSSVGVVFMLMGFLMIVIIFGQKIILGYPVGGRMLLLMSVLFMLMGVQVASIGLLGEIIAFTFGRHRKTYCIEKIL